MTSGKGGRYNSMLRDAAGALLFCAALTGCGAGAKEEVLEQEREPVVLWSYYETDAQNEALDELILDFNRSQTDYEASRQYVPMTEFTKRLTMAYTEESLPDLAVIDNPDMPACIRMGMFEDITEFARELDGFAAYYPSLMETVTIEGRIYGLPFNCNNLALLYNQDMLAEAGVEPPGNWEELMEAAKALTQGERSGFLMSAVEGEQGAFQILPWILSAGERQDQIGGESTVRALTLIQELIDKGYMTSNCINLSQTDVARVFAEGNAAMMENGPWVIPMLEETGMSYGICPLPSDERNSVVAGGENLGILKGKNTEGAKAFLAFYNQNSIMEDFCQKACVLPTKKNAELPVSNRTGQLSIFKKQMELAVVRTSIPSWNRLAERLPKAVYQMVAEGTTPKEAALDLTLLK